GLIMGYGIARGLSKSIYQLSVHVQDMAQRLDEGVASVRVVADGDLDNLDKHLQHVVGRVEEVTARLQRHHWEMLRAQQMSAVGQLAASVAHEVRNPLTSVKMLVEAALRTQNPKPFTRDNLAVIHNEVVRLEQTVQGFLDFARPPSLKFQDCDLSEVVAQAVELVRARARQQRVEIDCRSTDETVMLHIDPGQFCNVLVNLFINALDAMPDGGHLEILIKQRPGDGVQITICDTGTGIPEEMSDRLFTPFASTKATGTGLGLSISQRIVKDHQGKISAGNRPEGGACVTITLPASKAAPIASVAAAGSAST
ncbi:MAG: sensor histidine kinase, partial [Gemmataceae bacterium]